MRISIAVLLACSGISLADPIDYQEQNCSMEFPATWRKAEKPPEALAVFRSPDGAKGVVLMAFKIAPEEVSTALTKLVAGAKNAAIKQGVAIIGERDLDIHEISFHAFSAVLPNKVATVSNMAVAGNWGYSVQGFSSVSDPVVDPEINGAIQSFRLLVPTAVTAKIAEPEGEAYKVGRIAGSLAVVAFLAGAIILTVRKLLNGKKALP